MTHSTPDRSPVHTLPDDCVLVERAALEQQFRAVMMLANALAKALGYELVRVRRVGVRERDA